MRFRTFIVRGTRKTSHIAHHSTKKAGKFFKRVEDKTTRMLLGTDSSFGMVPHTSLDKIYYATIPYIIPLHPALPKAGRDPMVTLLLPSLDKNSFFGGTATAIIAAARLAEKKSYDLRIIQTLKRGEAPVKEFLSNAGVEFKKEIFFVDVSGRTHNMYGYVDIHKDDVFIASAWWDAYLLDRLPLHSKYVYMIQDFEPIFYNNSDAYALAESTYHSENFIPLCNTKLMYDFMINRHYFKAGYGTWFEPAVSHSKENFVRKPAHGEKHRLFLYGRLNVARNLFFTALNGIDDCFINGYLDPNHWEVVMAGQDHLPDIQLSSGVVVKNLGKMTLDDYRKFASTVDVAVSLMMAPHPNYPTLEFASIGSGVVTTRYDIKQDLTNYSKNIVMADISPESVSGAIRQAANLSHETRIENALTSNIPSKWSEALDEALASIVDKL